MLVYSEQQAFIMQLQINLLEHVLYNRCKQCNSSPGLLSLSESCILWMMESHLFHVSCTLYSDFASIAKQTKIKV